MTNHYPQQQPAGYPTDTPVPAEGYPGPPSAPAVPPRPAQTSDEHWGWPVAGLVLELFGFDTYGLDSRKNWAVFGLTIVCTLVFVGVGILVSLIH